MCNPATENKIIRSRKCSGKNNDIEKVFLLKATFSSKYIRAGCCFANRLLQSTGADLRTYRSEKTKRELLLLSEVSTLVADKNLAFKISYISSKNDIFFT